MSTVKKFEKQPVIPDPPNTRTDTKSVFLQKADVFNPALKAWADSFNASVVDNLNALVDVLNQQLPYINTVSDADAAIRAVYTAIAQVNTVSSGIESVNACATRMDKIKLVAENMAEVVSAQGYAEEAKKWALIAEAVVNVKPATKEALGLVKVGTGLNIDLEGTLDVAPDQISSTTAGGVITVKDVAIGGNLADLASARGQIGDNIRINTASDLNAYTKAGNWLFSDAAAGENFPNIGRGGELNCYVSTTAIFQFFTEFPTIRGLLGCSLFLSLKLVTASPSTTGSSPSPSTKARRHRQPGQVALCLPRSPGSRKAF